MKKISSDVIIKILILLCFMIFYFKIIKNNEIIMYVHPRFIPFAIFGMISMFIVAIFLITESLQRKKKKLRFKNYVTFIIPLIMIFLMQSTSANSFSLMKTDNINTNSNEISNVNSSTPKIESDEQDENNNLYIKNSVIEVDTDNFLNSVDILTENADKYEGQEIEIEGFVHKNTTLKDNEFIVGRFVMICCAADLLVEGIKCDSNNQEIYPSDTWVKIQGKINTETVNSEIEPIIVVEHIEKDPNPDTKYLYPF